MGPSRQSDDAGRARTSLARPRHSWLPPVRFPLKTERECRLCGVVRVTRHDAGPAAIPWVEFWRRKGVDGRPSSDGLLVRIEARGTPACSPGEAGKTL
jgi:hypothetical protein